MYNILSHSLTTLLAWSWDHRMETLEDVRDVFGFRPSRRLRRGWHWSSRRCRAICLVQTLIVHKICSEIETLSRILFDVSSAVFCCFSFFKFSYFCRFCFWSQLVSRHQSLWSSPGTSCLQGVKIAMKKAMNSCGLPWAMNNMCSAINQLCFTNCKYTWLIGPCFNKFSNVFSLAVLCASACPTEVQASQTSRMGAVWSIARKWRLRACTQQQRLAVIPTNCIALLHTVCNPAPYPLAPEVSIWRIYMHTETDAHKNLWKKRCNGSFVWSKPNAHSVYFLFCQDQIVRFGGQTDPSLPCCGEENSTEKRLGSLVRTLDPNVCVMPKCSARLNSVSANSWSLTWNMEKQGNTREHLEWCAKAQRKNTCARQE